MFATVGSALALNTDLRYGIYDRFRSQPIARSHAWWGTSWATPSNMCYASCVLVFGFGAVLGFRTHGRLPSILGAVALLLGFALAIAGMFLLKGAVNHSAAVCFGVSTFSLSAMA